jgi:hypothetical protein
MELTSEQAEELRQLLQVAQGDAEALKAQSHDTQEVQAYREIIARYKWWLLLLEREKPWLPPIDEE